MDDELKRIQVLAGIPNATVTNNAPQLFIFIYEQADQVADETLNQLLKEGRRQQDLGKGWSLAWDSAHVPSGKPHAHVYLKGAELYAVNKDGTGHDGSSGLEIHNEPLTAIQRKWPKVKKFIESTDLDKLKVLVPQDVMEQAFAASHEDRAQ